MKFLSYISNFKFIHNQLDKCKKLTVFMFLFMNLLIFLPFLHDEIIVEGFTDKAIQKAIDCVSEKGGGVVLLPKGTYLLNNAIYMKDKIELIGQGNSTILKKNKGYFLGVAWNISAGDKKIRVKHTSSFEVGDGISIISESLSPSDVWLTQIIAKDRNSFIIKDPVNGNILLTSHPNIYSSFPCIWCKNVKNVSIKNIAIDGNMKDNFVINSWWDSGIGIVDSKDVKIDHVFMNYAAGDGISLNNAHHVSIKDSLIRNSARIGVHIGSGSKYTYMVNTTVENSGQAGIINRDGLYLCFDASFGIYENNIIKNNCYAGVSIGYCDGGNIFLNNQVTGNKIGILFRQDTYEINNIMFIQNRIDNNHSYNLLAERPVHYIFIDNWPSGYSIPGLSSYLYKLTNSAWERFQ